MRLMALVGGLEVPGGLLGTTVLLSQGGMDHDRMGTVTPGPDGFLDYPFHPTDRETWIAKPTVRHAYSTLIPGTGDGPYAQAVGSSSLTWLRFQGRAAPSWPVPNPPEVWFVYRCNPLISFSETTRLGETIARFPFMVAFAYTLDETNHFADILLPDRTDLEGTQLVRLGGTRYEEQFWEARGWALRQPVVEPQGDTREFTWIAGELARRTGLQSDFNAMINAGVCGLPLKTGQYDFSLALDAQHDVEEIWDAVCRAASVDVTDGEASDGLDWFKEHGFRVKPFPRLNWYLYPRMVELDRRFEQIVLVHCVREIDELAYYDYLIEHLPSHEFLGDLVTSKLRYYPTVTREEFVNMGRITGLIESGRLFADLGVPALDPETDRVMICGGPSMLRDLETILLARGFQEGNTSTPGDFVIERAFAER